jgi:hypothetical protein
MTQELIDRIVTKIFVIESDLSLIKKWLENGTDKDVEFLAEMNATQDPGAEYAVAYEVTAPEIPTDEDLANVQPLNPPVDELKERLELEATGETALSSITDALWLRFVKTIMLAGWTVEKLKASEPCKNVIFTKAESDLLKNLECLRFSMKGKDIDLNQALGQDWVTPIEAEVIKEFAKENKLK